MGKQVADRRPIVGDTRVILGETLALVLTIVVHTLIISPWLPPLASAFTSAVVVTLALTPIFYRRRLVSGRRLWFSLLLLALVIYFVARIG